MTSLEHHLQKQTDSFADFFWHRLRWKAVSDFLPAGEPFGYLDIGAGSGLFAQFLKRDFPKASYYFSEPIPSLRERLRNLHGADRDLTEAPIPSNVRFAALLDVIEHIDDDKSFFHSLIGKLPQGARVLITVPAFQLFWSSWDVALGHKRRYSRSQLADAVKSPETKIVTSFYLFPEMVPLAFVRKAKEKVFKSGDVQRAEFPELSKTVNDIFYGLGRVVFLFKWLIPFGTSVFALVEKK